MKFIKLKRTFQEGLKNFMRNGWLSFATVSVLAISLYVISVTVIWGVTAKIVIQYTQDKMNVRVYFNTNVEEKRIMEIKDNLVGYKEIKSIDYVSKEKALAQLKKLGEKNQRINDALDLVGENPLQSALAITANNPNDFEIIVKSIKSSSYNTDISYVDYENNKAAIEKLDGTIKIIKQVGLTLGVVFIFIGILITFNAIRLTMYSHRQEFEIMRLVGASNTYIRMPFVFEGIFYGIASAIVVIIAIFLTSEFIAMIIKDIPGGFDIVFNLKNYFIMFGLLLVSGVVLGVISGVIAIRRYLKV